jgi:hypothetical protein
MNLEVSVLPPHPLLNQPTPGWGVGWSVMDRGHALSATGDFRCSLEQLLGTLYDVVGHSSLLSTVGRLR